MRSLKRTNIGISDSVVAFMVAIAWTTAPVVRVQISKEFKLTMKRVSCIRGEYRVLDEMHVTVKPGQELFFTRSGFDGFYYLTSVDGCTCKSGRFHQPCKHVKNVREFSGYAQVA